MIKNLQIKNFKGLSDLKVNDVARVNLIGGSNNVGKSSLLEALFLFHARINPNMFLNLHGLRGLKTVGNAPETMWAPMFSSFDMESDIGITVDTDANGSQNLTVRFNNRYVRKTEQVKSLFEQPAEISTNIELTPSDALELIYCSSSDQKIQKAYLWFDSGAFKLDTEFMSAPPQTTYFGANPRGDSQRDAERFGKLDISGEQDEIIEFISSSIEPRLIGLSSIALANKSALYAQLKGMTRKIPISYMGDGMARLLSIILTISTTKDGCVFIDEIENGIHYSVLPKIWHGIMAAAKKFNCQIFATTHSYECLASAVKGIDDANADEFRYIRLNRNDDKLRSTTYSFAELAASVEREWEVR